ncbi:MAG: hypothetical protein ACRDWW_09555 [Acidimicrobiales bacterium]
MKVLVALAIGYAVGTYSGRKDLDQLSRSVKALCETDEFAEVVSVARTHVGHTLRGLAEIVDGPHGVTPEGADLVAKVRNLVGHD